LQSVYLLTVLLARNRRWFWVLGRWLCARRQSSAAVQLKTSETCRLHAQPAADQTVRELPAAPCMHCTPCIQLSFDAATTYAVLGVIRR